MYSQDEKSTAKSSSIDASKLMEMNLQQHHERCLALHPRPWFVVERAPDFGEVREVLHALSRRVEPEIHVTSIARRLATLYCLSFLEELPFLHRHRTERGDVHGQHERAQDAVRPAHILRTLNSTQSDRTSGSLTRPSAQGTSTASSVIFRWKEFVHGFSAREDWPAISFSRRLIACVNSGALGCCAETLQ